MKKIVTLAAVFIFSLFSFVSYSQEMNRRMMDRDEVKKRMEMRQKMGQNKNVPKKNPLDHLKLSDEQKKLFKTISSKHDDLLESSKKDLKRKKLQIELEKMNDNVDVKTINKLIDDISVIQAQVMKSTFNKNLEIKSILDKDQALMFDKLLQRKQRMAKQKKMPSRNRRN